MVVPVTGQSIQNLQNPAQAYQASPDFQTDYNYEQEYLKARSQQRLASANKSFNEQMKDYNIDRRKVEQDYLRDMNTVNQYLKYNMDERVNNLAKTNLNLADALQRATESYWEQNLLGSWVAAQRSRVAATEWSIAKEWLHQDRFKQADILTRNRDKEVRTYHEYDIPKLDIRKENIMESFQKARAWAKYNPLSPEAFATKKTTEMLF